MPSAEIPQIRGLPESVLAAVGESVQVFIHGDDPSIGPVQHSSHEMVREVVEDMFIREGVRPNRDLETLCVLAARIAVAKLAASPGFTVELGGSWMERNPREVIDVKLRPDAPLVREAEVIIDSQT